MIFTLRSAVTLFGLLATVSSHPNRHSHHHNHNHTSRIEKRYALQDSYTASNFFNGFTFFTGPDPTHGYVQYITQFEAYLLGYINNNNNQIYLGVDHKTVNPANGRLSVRVQSNKAYTHGLFIADIQHMPGSICGVWPSYWMFGPNFPSSGEIDIIENVNYAFTNQLTLHSNPGCSINIAGSAAGDTLLNANCNTNNGNDGCSVTTTNQNAYGNFFNQNGGGVYATQWSSTGVKHWFFQRGHIPADITNNAPNPAGWGTPLVSFNAGTTCNFDSFFKNNNIVFDIDFCGDWAGNVWASSPCFSVFGGTCQQFVGANPSVFSEAYWLINSLKVYQ